MKTFITDKATETHWLTPILARMPMPDGSERYVHHPRWFWLGYWVLRDAGYNPDWIAVQTQRLAERIRLPYDACFPLCVNKTYLQAKKRQR